MGGLTNDRCVMPRPHSPPAAPPCRTIDGETEAWRGESWTRDYTENQWLSGLEPGTGALESQTEIKTLYK